MNISTAASEVGLQKWNFFNQPKTTIAFSSMAGYHSEQINHVT